MPRSFDASEFSDNLTESGLSIYQLARRALTPMFRMRRILRGNVPIGERRTRIATVLSNAIGGETPPVPAELVDDIWPEDD